VIVFLPPEGRISAPLHDALDLLLGRATFMLPLGLAFVGVLLLVRRARPAAELQRRRLVGVGLVAVSVLAAEHLLANGSQGSGLVGAWLSSWLVDLVGFGGTLVVVVGFLVAGTLLAFDVRFGDADKAIDAAG
jgi:DNA translocase FtsK/SpoIIIE-like protein